MRTRDINRLLARDPNTVFLVDLPMWRHGSQAGREVVPAYINGVEKHPHGGYAKLFPAPGGRTVPRRFPVQMILGYRGS